MPTLKTSAPRTGTTALRCAGAGFIALDVVMQPGVPAWTMTGGSCGNVLLGLAYLGWDALPIARLGGDALSDVVVEELVEWGCDVSFVDRRSGSTPVVAERLRSLNSTSFSHSFSLRC